MIKIYTLLAFRNFKRRKLHTILNIAGLALGLAVSLIIIQHVRYELSFDKHIPDLDEVHRVVQDKKGNAQRAWANGSTKAAKDLCSFYPEVRSATRLAPFGTTFTRGKNEQEKLTVQVPNGVFADSSFFDVFGIQLIHGNPNDALLNKDQIVVSRNLAKKLFGREDVVGEELFMVSGEQVLRVSGVMPNQPETSHFRMDCVYSFSLLKFFLYADGLRDLYENKHWKGPYTYLRFHKNFDLNSINERLPEFYKWHYENVLSEESIESDMAWRFQPVKDIHLKSHLEQEFGVNGNIVYVYVFILITIFILIVAGVNYVNIATSLSFHRMREVAIRKIHGSNVFKLRVQFVLESVILVFISGILAILILDLLLPYYVEVSGNAFESIEIILHNIWIFIALILVLGISAGVYPAFFISNFKVVESLKGVKNQQGKTARVRKMLLVFQFTVAIFMIFSTLGIYRQIQFFINQNMGFDKHLLVGLDIAGELRAYATEHYESFKDGFQKLNAVKKVSFASGLPGDRLSVEGLNVQMGPNATGGSIRFMRVDPDYVETMGLEIIDGKGFTNNGHKTSQFILNEKSQRILDLENPVGMCASSMFGGDGEIKAVIKDYHFASLQENIEPLVLECNLTAGLKGATVANIVIRLNEGSLDENLSEIRSYIKSLVPEAHIDFEFMDEHLGKYYANEKNMSKLFLGFCFITIFISVLGLFGMVSFTAELKQKEAGIRKALGASYISMFHMMSKEFILYVGIALCIALPLAYMYILDWLHNFAYHTNLSGLLILQTAGLIVLISYATIFFHTRRMVRKPPADSLKCE